MGRLSNSPPPKSAQEQDKGRTMAGEWPGWATVENYVAGGTISIAKASTLPALGKGARRGRARGSIDGADDRRDTLLMPMSWISCFGEVLESPGSLLGTARSEEH